MATNGKQKGKRGELELARKLREYGYDGARRTVQYNGKADDGEADLLGLPGIHIECKRTERLNLYDAIGQAKRDSEESGDLPAVFHRRNYSEWLVVMPLDDWMKLYKEFELNQEVDEYGSKR
jgi:Holliday junction resolvase